MPLEITKPLADLQADALARIDSAASAKHNQYVTPGMDAIYSAKLTEARALKADNNPNNVGTYVWINEEAKATGKTAQQVADAVMVAANTWATASAKIEGQRQAAKQAIKAATSAAAVHAVVAQFRNNITLL